MASITVDTSEVRAAAASIREGGIRAAREVRPLVAASAAKIQEQMRAEADASTHFRFARSITTSLLEGGLVAEIGPRKGRPGSIANIAYFGGSNGGGGTVADPRGALESEVPNFISAVDKLMASL